MIFFFLFVNKIVVFEVLFELFLDHSMQRGKEHLNEKEETLVLTQHSVTTSFSGSSFLCKVRFWSR